MTASLVYDRDDRGAGYSRDGEPQNGLPAGPDYGGDMHRRTQGIVALGASVALGVLAGVLVSTSVPGHEVSDPSATPSPSGVGPSPSSSTGNNPAAVAGAPSTTPSLETTPTPTVRRSPSPTETEDDRGRERGRGGDSRSGGDSGGPGRNDDDSGDDG